MASSQSDDCVFCRIASGNTEAVLLHESDRVVAFLDILPIRRGHTQIIPRKHVETFESLDPQAASEIIHVGQAIARRMKQIYPVDRVAFLFTGGDVPHVHAHVVPMHEKTDITSARYIVSDSPVQWASNHLRTELADLREVRAELTEDE